MRWTRTIFAAVIALVFAATAWAGPLGAMKEWFSWTAIAFILSGVLAMGVIAKYTPWISKLLVAGGALMTGMGIGLSDGKISADELKQWKSDFTVLKDTIKEGWK